ncbi:MAG TPA: metal ABC transporter substrate-binding protein [Lacunisphaera sp.]|jgi:zinc/manganese transport system substrate-binding protein|nr:metal ABC transporter substrate-binding protein [Lacunisphaera sp.]
MKTFLRNFLTVLLGITAVAASARLHVVATTPDLGAIAAAIGGDDLDLTVLAKPTEDPHFVDAKPSYLVKLNRADALIEGGAELEAGWLAPLLEGARNPRLERGKPGRIIAAEGIALLEVPAVLDRSQGDIHASGNPHFLTDPVNAGIVAAHIARALGELDAKSAPEFQANLKKFETELQARLAGWQRQLAPYAGRPVVTYHNYWIYFGRRFQLPMDLFLEPKPGIPPTPAHLAGVITKMRADHLRLIAVQPYQNRKTAETVAGHTDAVVLDWPSFPGGPGTESYFAWMDYLVTTTAKAFAAQP